MILNTDFCMEKLLARDVTIFPEKIISLNILAKSSNRPLTFDKFS